VEGNGRGGESINKAQFLCLIDTGNIETAYFAGSIFSDKTMVLDSGFCCSAPLSEASHHLVHFPEHLPFVTLRK